MVDMQGLSFFPLHVCMLKSQINTQITSAVFPEDPKISEV